MTSLDLRHFPKNDPRTLTERDEERITIAKQIKEYLSTGKTIKEVDHTANASYGQPIKRSRKDQIKHVKRRQKLPQGKPPSRQGG